MVCNDKLNEHCPVPIDWSLQIPRKFLKFSSSLFPGWFIDLCFVCCTSFPLGFQPEITWSFDKTEGGKTRPTGCLPSTVLPRVDNDLQVEIVPVGLLHVSIINPLWSGDVWEMLEHDEVLALYVGLPVSLLLTFLLFVPERGERREERGEGKEVVGGLWPTWCGSTGSWWGGRSQSSARQTEPSVCGERTSSCPRVGRTAPWQETF